MMTLLRDFHNDLSVLYPLTVIKSVYYYYSEDFFPVEHSITDNF